MRVRAAGKHILSALAAVLLCLSLLPALTLHAGAAAVHGSGDTAFWTDTVTLAPNATQSDLQNAIDGAGAAPRKIVLQCSIELTTQLKIPGDVAKTSAPTIMLISSGDNSWAVRQTTGANQRVIMTGEASTLYLERIELSGGNIDTGAGAGVYCAGSLYVLEGALIRNNVNSYAYGAGGGLYCNSRTAQLNISGGVISGNTAYQGGGVYVGYSDVGMQMSGGVIRDNTAGGGGGGGVFCAHSPFTMNGGVIRDNTSNGDGGGILLNSSKYPFIMNDGVISGNKARSGGGVQVYWDSVFNMNGGVISGNEAGLGGGIYVYSYVYGTDVVRSSLSISGGELSGNSATYGGGVYATHYEHLTVSKDAKFFGNTASGGVMLLKPADQYWTVYSVNIGIPDTLWSSGLRYGYNNYDINYETSGSAKADSGLSLIIHKYALSGDIMPGKPGTGLASDEAAVLESGALPLPGVPFDLYLALKLNAPVNSFTLDSYDAPTGLTTGFATYPLIKIKNSDSKTDDGGVLAFKDLSDGVYLVVEGCSDAVQKPSEPFLVQLPMENPAYNPGGADDNTNPRLLGEVHVYPKNEVIKVTKESQSRPEVREGDTVLYTVAIEKPYNYGQLDKFELVDELCEALNFTPGSLTLELHKAGSSLGPAVAYAYDISGQTLTVNLKGITPADFDSIAVTFGVTVNDKADGKAVTVIGNTAYMDFGNGQRVYSNTDEIAVKPPKDDYQLPLAGGAGLTPFAVAGVAILSAAGAVIAGIRKKKS